MGDGITSARVPTVQPRVERLAAGASSRSVPEQRSRPRLDEP